MQGFDFANLGLLLCLATLVAMVSRRLDLPYATGLVAAGVGIALLLPRAALPALTPGLIYYVLLPPLVFEAAIQIPWRSFRRELPLLSALVTLGVALAAGVAAVGMHWWAGWSWLGAGLFGVLIAATDPVSVIAAFKQTRVEPRLHLLVEAESLLNDGAAAVGFAVLSAVAAGGGLSVAGVGWRFVETSVGGVVVGLAVAAALILLAGRTTDRLVETAITTLVAYGSFLLAEHFHCSGVLATLSAGMLVGNWGFLGRISEGGRAAVLDTWEYAAFLINSLVFLLIGGREAQLVGRFTLEATALAVVLALIGRALAVYPVILAFARTRLRVPWAYKHVLFWGGLRGALALALAMALPREVAERDTIVTVVFAVVAFSVFVQGLTMPVLVRKLGLLVGGGSREQGAGSE